MSRTTRLLTLALAFGVLIVPVRASEPGAGVDHDGRRPAAVSRRQNRSEDADGDEDAGRRRGARHHAVEDAWPRTPARRRPRSPSSSASAGERPQSQPARFAPTIRRPTRSATGTATTTSSAPARRGIGVYFNVTGPGPGVGARRRRPSGEQQRCAHLEAQAARVQAVRQGRRQALLGQLQGRERRAAGRCRACSFWSLWNEPNQAGWLTPQWETGGAPSPPRCTASCTVRHEGLVATGHRGQRHHPARRDRAARAPTAAAASPMRPGCFLASCLHAPAGRQRAPPRGPRLRRLRRARPAAATGYAHHPYTKNVPPTVRDPNPDSLTMANIDDSATLLDTLVGADERRDPGRAAAVHDRVRLRDQPARSVLGRRRSPRRRSTT